MSKALATIIEVVPIDGDLRPVAVRERLALKRLLRSCGLRCVSIRDEPAEQGSNRNGLAKLNTGSRQS